MAAEPEPDLKLEIAHVLTMDVVAYATLLIHEQSRVVAELNKIVRQTPRFRIAEAEGKLIRIPTGDGMALVFFGDPEGPIECAMQISAELASRSYIRLRMGIHSGPINQILDVNDRSNVAGAGIDMAQRVMDCGDAGHILVSKRVADDLAPYPRWSNYLHDLGECEVKHGRRVSVVNFYNDTLGNPAIPRKFQPRAGPQRRSSRTRFVVASVVVALAVAIGLTLRMWPRAQRPSVAVLPFHDLSQAHDQDYFSDGLTERIIKTLRRIPGVLVIDRSSSFTFKGKNEDPRQAGKKLGVTHVVEGSIIRELGRVIVTANLIDIATGDKPWNQEYDVNENDALFLQNKIANGVARALRLRLRLSETAGISSDPEANDLYFQGRSLLNKRTVASLQRAREFFARAVARDPKFALAHTGIADAYILLGEYGVLSPNEASEHAWPALATAMQINNQLAEPHMSRALLLTDFKWNWPAAERDYREAIELDPESATAHHWFALHQAELGKIEEALDEISLAERNDPLSPIVRAAKAKILLMGHRYEEAIAQVAKVFELAPNFTPAYSVIAQAYLFQGKHAEAIEAAKKYVDLAGGGDQELLELAFVYAAADRKGEAEQIMRDAESHPGNFSPYDMAAIHAALSDHAGALRWLKKSVEQHSIDAVWIRVDPRLDVLRADLGFHDLLTQVTPRR